MKTTLVAVGCAAAAVRILLGADQVFHDVYRSWFFDGSAAFDAAGREVVRHGKPIRVGNVMMGGRGVAMLLVGVLLAVAVHQVRPKS